MAGGCRNELNIIFFNKPSRSVFEQRQTFPEVVDFKSTKKEVFLNIKFEY